MPDYTVELRIGRIPPPPPPPWAPSDESTCLVWNQADDLSVGSSVTTWTNRISGGESWSQANISNKPTVVDGIFGGRPGVYFTIDDYLLADSGALSTHFSITDTQWSVVMIAKTGSLGSFGCWLSTGSSSTSTPYRMMLYHGTGVASYNSYIRDNASSYKTVTNPSLLAANTNYLLAARCNGTNITMYLSSLSPIVTLADINVGAITQDLVTLGSGRRQTTLLYPLTGYIGYCTIYSTYLSDDTMEEAIRHGATWGGISV